MHIGFPEILVIVLFAFIIFGPKRLPEIGKSIGKAINQFNGAKTKVDDALKKEGLDAESLREASKNPFVALDKLATIADKMEEVLPVEEGESEGDGELQEPSESAETADAVIDASEPAPEANEPSEPVEEPQETIEEPEVAEEVAAEPEVAEEPASEPEPASEAPSEPALEPESEPAPAEQPEPAPAEPESGEEGERA